MPIKRKIPLDPINPIYYVIDSNFFANKYLLPREGENQTDSLRIENSNEWWDIISYQINKKFAVVYVSELCVAETFKIIAKKYYQLRKISKTRYYYIRNCIEKDIRLTIRQLISTSRHIKYHDQEVNRDIIIGASRFLEIAQKNNLHRISVIDLVILSQTKYLIDFYRIKKEDIFLLTGDIDIIRCSLLCSDIPSAINALDPDNPYYKFFQK